MNDDLYDAMYASDEDAVNSRPMKDSAENRGATIALKIGDETVLVPNPAYVARLEQRINELTQSVRRLEGAVMQTRHAVRANAHALNDVRTDLDGKVDLRNGL
jgi:uncharacterized small protein (DUF1192 family)